MLLGLLLCMLKLLHNKGLKQSLPVQGWYKDGVRGYKCKTIVNCCLSFLDFHCLEMRGLEQLNRKAPFTIHFYECLKPD